MPPIGRKKNKTIHFTEEEARCVMHPYNDAIVVGAQIASNMVKRILVDSGSSSDILIKSVLDQMNFNNVHPIPTQTPLICFTEGRIDTEGSIILPVTFGMDGEAYIT